MALQIFSHCSWLEGMIGKVAVTEGSLARTSPLLGPHGHPFPQPGPLDSQFPEHACTLLCFQGPAPGDSLTQPGPSQKASHSPPSSHAPFQRSAALSITPRVGEERGQKPEGLSRIQPLSPAGFLSWESHSTSYCSMFRERKLGQGI